MKMQEQRQNMLSRSMMKIDNIRILPKIRKKFKKKTSTKSIRENEGISLTFRWLDANIIKKNAKIYMRFSASKSHSTLSHSKLIFRLSIFIWTEYLRLNFSEITRHINTLNHHFRIPQNGNTLFGRYKSIYGSSTRSIAK